jgi:hypothetical protein
LIAKHRCRRNLIAGFDRVGVIEAGDLRHDRGSSRGPRPQEYGRSRWCVEVNSMVKFRGSAEYSRQHDDANHALLG